MNTIEAQKQEINALKQKLAGEPSAITNRKPSLASMAAGRGLTKTQAKAEFEEMRKSLPAWPDPKADAFGHVTLSSYLIEIEKMLVSLEAGGSSAALSAKSLPTLAPSSSSLSALESSSSSPIQAIKARVADLEDQIDRGMHNAGDGRGKRTKAYDEALASEKLTRFSDPEKRLSIAGAVLDRFNAEAAASNAIAAKGASVRASSPPSAVLPPGRARMEARLNAKFNGHVSPPNATSDEAEAMRTGRPFHMPRLDKTALEQPPKTSTDGNKVKPGASRLEARLTAKYGGKK